MSNNRASKKHTRSKSSSQTSSSRQCGHYGSRYDVENVTMGGNKNKDQDFLNLEQTSRDDSECCFAAEYDQDSLRCGSGHSKGSRHSKGSKRGHSEVTEDGDRGSNNNRPKTVPWVPPPLPEHLRSFPITAYHQLISSKPTFLQPFPAGMSRAPPLQQVKNQFQNDGTFLDLYLHEMRLINDLEKTWGRMDKDADAEPAAQSASAEKPVVIKRRATKVLKTGIIHKQKKDEQAAKEICRKDGWSSYMTEVQKYSADKFIDTESCRPLMK